MSKDIRDIKDKLNRESQRISNGKTGAKSEMLVACDLLDKGFEVFRAVSPSASCDLIILNGNQTERVEVRTGRNNQDGTVSCGVDIYDIGRFDILAVAIKDSHDVKYFMEDDIHIEGKSIYVGNRIIERTKKRFKCEKCKRCYYYEKPYLEHIGICNGLKVKHLEIKVICKHCGREFKSESGLHKHESPCGILSSIRKQYK